jgi:CheY-like chemotaxis protein
MIRVMIVEDDPFIAFDLAEQLEEAGLATTGIAATVGEALDLFARHGCDIAILDINLGDETASPIAQLLADRNVPFVAVTGYSLDQVPPEFNDATVLTKPVRVEKLVSALIARVGGNGRQTPDRRLPNNEPY